MSLHKVLLLLQDCGTTVSLAPLSRLLAFLHGYHFQNVFRKLGKENLQGHSQFKSSTLFNFPDIFNGGKDTANISGDSSFNVVFLINFY